ncbi:hypothetical protein H0H81_009310 [Sphagnurus paluster]|uniref:Uncharacterized protein n=1 Tax=Sphagnurus paluster TaxID=117069 RepID=A0A9P7FVW1_9AGAR|nr:hypothetical protein H0H81_009310 [Sphagnurus paluster]
MEWLTSFLSPTFAPKESEVPKQDDEQTQDSDFWPDEGNTPTIAEAGPSTKIPLAVPFPQVSRWDNALRSTPATTVQQVATNSQPPVDDRPITGPFALMSQATQLMKSATLKIGLLEDGKAQEDKDETPRATIERLKRENEKAKRDLADNVAASQRVQVDFDTYRTCTEQKLLTVKDDLRLAEAQYNQIQQELLVAKEEIQRAEAQHERTRNSLKERTKELRSANLFLSQADSLSSADIIAMVNTLNAEILQGAAVLADSLEYARGGPTPTAEAVGATQMLIGEDLVQALLAQRDQEEFDPTVVQLALQVCLVHCCNSVIETWTIREDAAFKEVYTSIYRQEKQAIAGRWRSITQRHAPKAGSPVNWFAQCTMGVLLLAGWSPGDSKVLPGRFQNRLVIIGTQAQRLRTAIGEVISMDIKPYIYPSGASFNPMNMEDTYRETADETKVGQRIAGSTELVYAAIFKDEQFFVRDPNRRKIENQKVIPSFKNIYHPGQKFEA